ncbi:MAG TPA: peroxiredoxin [Patescibacteria group bacterium]|nr:peroxiredoxin [Patescibacteria group bacterium]
MIKLGQKAPNIILEGFKANHIKKYNLKDYRKKWVILFFYPLDFSFVCPTEIIALNKKYQEFADSHTEILGVSVDSVYAHQEWSRQLGDIKFPLLSDINKEAIQKYEIDLASGISSRGTFIIDPKGIIRYILVSDNNVGRSVTEILRVLKALQTGEMSPAGWKPGQKTLGKG